MLLFHKGLERLMYIIEGHTERAETILFSYNLKMQTCYVRAAVTLLSLLLKSLKMSCETSLAFFPFRFKDDGKNCGPGPRQLKVSAIQEMLEY